MMVDCVAESDKVAGSKQIEFTRIVPADKLELGRIVYFRRFAVEVFLVEGFPFLLQLECGEHAGGVDRHLLVFFCDLPLSVIQIILLAVFEKGFVSIVLPAGRILIALIQILIQLLQVLPAPYACAKGFLQLSAVSVRQQIRVEGKINLVVEI